MAGKQQQQERNAQKWTGRGKRGSGHEKAGVVQKLLLTLTLIPLPLTEQGPQRLLGGGGRNSRSSLGTCAAEPVLGLEVTLRTERRKVPATVGSVCVNHGSALCSGFPCSADFATSWASEPGWSWGLRAGQKRGKEGRVGAANNSLSMGTGGE